MSVAQLQNDAVTRTTQMLLDHSSKTTDLLARQTDSLTRQLTQSLQVVATKEHLPPHIMYEQGRDAAGKRAYDQARKRAYDPARYEQGREERKHRRTTSASHLPEDKLQPSPCPSWEHEGSPSPPPSP